MHYMFGSHLGRLMSSIFLQIPAYRDLELPETIKDAISRSSGKNKLVFGIHNCLMPEDQISISDIETPDHVEIRYIESIAPENIGVQLSRYVSNELYADEDYYLQTDAHMRFQNNWDVLAIEDYKWYESLGIENPLITMYPPRYVYTYTKEVSLENVIAPSDHSTRISFRERPDDFVTRFIPSQLAISIPQGCQYTSSVAGGMIFTNGSFAKIKPNRKVAFWGEEILIAARAFTHGFNLVTARHHIVWHLYHSGQTYEYARRHHAWADWPDIWKTLDQESRLEVKNIFETARVGDDALGSVRSLEDFGIFAGLDFKNKKVITSRD
jgi:Glycosyltransferase (GlcNAc)